MREVEEEVFDIILPARAGKREPAEMNQDLKLWAAATRSDPTFRSVS